MKKLSKKQWILAAGIGIILLLASNFVWNQLNKPSNLGTNLEYIGKINVGCEWWQVPFYLGSCRGPSYCYYYSTNMDESEAKAYFKYAVQKYESSTVSADYNYANLIFEEKTDPHVSFEIGYFDENNTQKMLNIHPDLKKTYNKYN